MQCFAGLHSALLLLLLLLWRMLYSIIANFVMVARRVVVCHAKLSRVNAMPAMPGRQPIPAIVLQIVLQIVLPGSLVWP
jgi:hypothetical protein